MTDTTTSSSFENDVYATTYPETEPFWRASANSKLLLKRCAACMKTHWYPRVVCPLCGSDKTDWIEASGRGEVYSYSVIERADPQYILAWVRLEEGPTLITNIVDCKLDAVGIGDQVEVAFRRAKEGRTVPVFVPADRRMTLRAAT